MSWLDLNLLAVFEAVMRERSITRAGRRLGMSQPAVSQSLARLRVMLKDELLVRGADGMVPTQRAEELAGPVREALAILELALEPPAARPADITRSYTIAVNGYTASVLTNEIVEALRRDAPQVRLQVVPSGTRDVLDELDTGLLDLALTGMTGGGDRFKCCRVMSDRYVAVLRAGHPDASASLSLEALARMRHLAVTSTADDTSFLDRALAARGLARHAGLGLPFLATPEALARSDLVAILPARVADRLARTWPLRACAIACDAPPIELAMTWHRRLDAHADHRWLRATIRGCLGGIGRAAA